MRRLFLYGGSERVEKIISEQNSFYFYFSYGSLCYFCLTDFNKALYANYSDSNVGPVIAFSTSSSANITFKLTITSEDDFYIRPSEEHHIRVSPSEPR